MIISHSLPGIKRFLQPLRTWQPARLTMLMRLIAGFVLHAGHGASQSALARDESRGTHLRTDFPTLDDTRWNRHIWFRRTASEETMGIS